MISTIDNYIYKLHFSLIYLISILNFDKLFNSNLWLNDYNWREFLVTDLLLIW